MTVHITLAQNAGIGLIIETAQGLTYSHQSGGLALRYPELTGAYIPFGSESQRLAVKLAATFVDHTWSGGEILTEARADAIDAALQESGCSAVRVNRTRLANSHEAWVHIEIVEDEANSRSYGNTIGWVFIGESEVSGLGGSKGVLVWPNSD